MTDRIVALDELTADDQAALAWAASTEHPAAVAITIRVRGGEDPNIAASELAAIHADWQGAGRPEPQAHVHRTPVTFVDGTTVMGVRFLGDDPYVRDHTPDFGLYLDEHWDPPWPYAHFEWPDYGVPEDLDALRHVLNNVLDRARRGDRVEVGCYGGHGRTGTALACLAVLAGTPAAEALDWIRTNYCYKAVETDVQEHLVAHWSG